MMAVIAEEFERLANGEAIQFAVIGEYNPSSWINSKAPLERAPVGKLLPWSEARRFLEYDYDNGFGSADCHPVYAWTPTRIIFIVEYDGATGPAFLPRHPIDCVPEFNGSDEQW